MCVRMCPVEWLIYKPVKAGGLLVMLLVDYAHSTIITCCVLWKPVFISAETTCGGVPIPHGPFHCCGEDTDHPAIWNSVAQICC